MTKKSYEEFVKEASRIYNINGINEECIEYYYRKPDSRAQYFHIVYLQIFLGRNLLSRNIKFKKK